MMNKRRTAVQTVVMLVVLSALICPLKTVVAAQETAQKCPACPASSSGEDSKHGSDSDRACPWASVAVHSNPAIEFGQATKSAGSNQVPVKISNQGLNIQYPALERVLQTLFFSSGPPGQAIRIRISSLVI